MQGSDVRLKWLARPVEKLDPPWKESLKHHQVLDALKASSDAAVEGRFRVHLGGVFFEQLR